MLVEIPSRDLVDFNIIAAARRGGAPWVEIPSGDLVDFNDAWELVVKNPTSCRDPSQEGLVDFNYRRYSDDIVILGHRGSF